MKPKLRNEESRLKNTKNKTEPALVSKTTLSKKRVIKSVKKAEKTNVFGTRPNRRPWTNEQMIAALDLVHKQKKTLTFAADKYKIPLSTLRIYTVNKTLAKTLYEKSNNKDEFVEEDAEELDEDGEEEEEEDEESEMDEEVDLDPAGTYLKPAKRKKYDEPNNNDDDALNESSSSDEETREIFVDSPRTAMAKKSTSPIKFYLNNLLKSQTSESSQSAKSSNGSLTSLIVNNKNNNSNRQSVPRGLTKQQRQNTPNEHLNSYNSALTPSTFSVIDFIINNKIPTATTTATIASTNSQTNFNLTTNSLSSVYNYLSQKSKLIEEFDKSVKIYAYLNLRQRYNPLFLKRTLSYMSYDKRINPTFSGPSSFPIEPGEIPTPKKHLKRADFKVDQMLSNKLTTIAQSPRPQPTNRQVEIKFSFNHLQINSEKFLEELLPADSSDDEEVDESCDDKEKLVKAYVELYSLNHESKAASLSRIGKCKCSISLNMRRTSRGSLSGLKMPKLAPKKCEIKFKMLPTNVCLTNYLIRVYVRKKKKNGKCKNASRLANEENSRQKSAKNSRRNSRKSRNNRRSTNKIDTGKINNPKIKQIFSIFSLRTNKESLNLNHNQSRSEMKEFLEKIKWSMPELNIENNSTYSIEARQISEKYKDFVEKLIASDAAMNESGEEDDEDEDDEAEDGDEKNDESVCEEMNTSLLSSENGKTNRSKVGSEAGGANKRPRRSTLPEEPEKINSAADRLISQFMNNKQSALLNFSIEMNTVLSCASTIFASPTTTTSTTMSLRKRCSPRRTPPTLNPKETSQIIETSPAKTTTPTTKSSPQVEKRVTRGASTINNAKLLDTIPTTTTTTTRNNYQVFYQFNAQQQLHTSNRSKANRNINPNFKLLTQMTTSQVNSVLTCPFCYFHFPHPNFLMSHLQMCHFRFIIEPQQTNNNHSLSNVSSLISEPSNGSSSAAVALANFHSTNTSSKQVNRKVHFNVTCDEIFDGSYLGNPYDAQYAAHLGYSKSRLTTAKRSPLTYILVNKRSNFIDLKKFTDLTSSEQAALNFVQHQLQLMNCPMQPNNLYNCQAGFERLYYHTTTTLPMHVNELDYDSDNDLDPDWMKEQTALLINEFADVNDGEKNIMRLWNLHCLRHNFVADSQIYSACELFIKEQTHNLIHLSLFNNFLLHLANLSDYGLLKPNEIIKLTDVLYERKQQLIKLNEMPAETMSVGYMIKPGQVLKTSPKLAKCHNFNKNSPGKSRNS